MEEDFDYLFKVLLVGPPGVGKSALCLRYKENRFTDGDYHTTIGVEFTVKQFVTSVKGVRKVIKLQVWDTAGQERYQGITVPYYNGAKLIFIVFALDDVTSLDALSGIMKQIGKSRASDDALCVLVGNKNDLTEKKVTDRQANEFAEQYNMEYVKVSAKTDDNKVNETFQSYASRLAEKQMTNTMTSSKGKEGTIRQGETVSLERRKRTQEEQQQQTNRSCCGGTN